VGNIIPVFFPIIGWIIHLPAYLQETGFIITRHYVQYVQNKMPQTELQNTRTNALRPFMYTTARPAMPWRLGSSQQSNWGKHFYGMWYCNQACDATHFKGSQYLHLQCHAI